jgi:hypothetical protein
MGVNDSLNNPGTQALFVALAKQLGAYQTRHQAEPFTPDG